jgi:hypothetical protein
MWQPSCRCIDLRVVMLLLDLQVKGLFDEMTAANLR